MSNESRVQMTNVSSFSINATDTQAAVSVSFNHSTSSRYLQGFFLIDNEGQHQFHSTQTDVVPREIAISPDGEIIASSWYQGTMESGTTNITLYDANNGALINSWEFETSDVPSEITWLDDGSALVFTSGTALYKTAPIADAEPVPLIEGIQVQGILLTPDEKVVAVGMTDPAESSVPPTYTTALVNTETDDVQTLNGRNMWASSYGPASKRTVLVLSDQFAGWQSADTLVFQVIDAATGEKVGEIEHKPAASMSIANTSTQLDRGDVSLFSLGPDSTWQLLDADGTPNVRKISPPTTESVANDDQALVAMSSDGTMAFTITDPFSVWIKPAGDDEDWIQLDIAEPTDDSPLPLVVMFIPGSD